MVAILSDMAAVDAITLFFPSEGSSDPTEDRHFGSLLLFTHLGLVITDVHESCGMLEMLDMNNLTVDVVSPVQCVASCLCPSSVRTAVSLPQCELQLQHSLPTPVRLTQKTVRHGTEQ